MDEESISDANKVTVDTFSHTSNKQSKNANTTFTSEKLDKSGKLEDTLMDFTISNVKYYVSNSVNTRDAQVNLTRNPKTLTHTSNANLNKIYCLA